VTRIANDQSIQVRGSYVSTGARATSLTATPANLAGPAVQVLTGQTALLLASTGSLTSTAYSYIGHEYVTAPATRVTIDPNVRVRGNGTYAGFEDVDGPMAVGETVEVHEPESGLVGVGRITEIDGTRKLVYLSVDWSSLTDETTPAAPTGPQYQPPGPHGGLVFIPSEVSSPLTSTDDWMKLIPKPCLACVSVSDTVLLLTAPALMWPAGLQMFQPSSPYLQIMQSGTRVGNAYTVAA
jgi:hypothetical protein